MSWQEFNKHQEDNRKRAEFLAKSIFLLSGGALTFSLSIFLNDEKRTSIPVDLQPMIKDSWEFLFFSMISFVFVIGIMIIRDYIFAEKWRKNLEAKSPNAVKTKTLYRITDTFMWFFGLYGIYCFFKGFDLLRTITTSMVLVTG
jgi:hypothetical protein